MSIDAGAGDVAAVIAARPSPEVAAAVGVACGRLFTHETEFVERFAAALRQLVPRLEHTGPDQGRSLAEGLGRAVLWAALTDDQIEIVEATFQNIGADYVQQGFPDDGYHGAGHALLRAARDTYTAEWTSELSSGWVAYYSWLCAHLQRGAQLGAVLPAGELPHVALVRDEPTPGEPPHREPAHREPGRLPPPQQPPPYQEFAPPRWPDDGLTAAARRGEPAGFHDTPAHPAAGPGVFEDRTFDEAADGGPRTLDEILDQLYTRYFATDDRAVSAILTRVALRTGADLRAPRPEQRDDPAVVANVLAVLQVMGYPVQPAQDPIQVVVTSGLSADRQARWWNRVGPPPRGWRRAMPGIFR